MLRPAPNDRPNANPVRSFRLPGRMPRFDTSPYENPPFSATLPCAGATVVMPRAVAKRQASVRVMGETLPSVPGATPGREGRFPRSGATSSATCEELPLLEMLFYLGAASPHRLEFLVGEQRELIGAVG